MSKKTLLNETTVRRFMKLADMGTLSDTFINERGGFGGYQDEEPLEGGDEEPLEGGDEELDLPDEDEAPEAPEDLGPEEPMDEPMPEEDADEVEISEEDRDILGQAADILSKIAGGGEGGFDLEEPGLEEPGLEEPGLEEPGLEEPGLEEPGLEEPDMGEEDEEALMQEVARRVAHRLRKEGKGLAKAGGNKTNPWAKKGPNTVPDKGQLKEEDLEEGDEVLDEVEVVDENELVQEVTRRVAARLRAAMKSRK
jgi:hypothetical protein